MIGLNQKMQGIGEMLSRMQMKKVLGGIIAPPTGAGCCCAHDQHGNFDCGLSKSDAIDEASQSGVNWCCASCGSVGAASPCSFTD